MSSWAIWEPLFLPNQTLKYNNRLQWIINPNSVWSCPVVFSCCLLRRISSLAADTTRMRSLKDSTKQECYLLAAGWNNVLLVWRVSLNWECLFFILLQELFLFFFFFSFFFFFFFFAHASFYFLPGASGVFCIFKIDSYFIPPPYKIELAYYDVTSPAC